MARRFRLRLMAVRGCLIHSRRAIQKQIHSGQHDDARASLLLSVYLFVCVLYGAGALALSPGADKQKTQPVAIRWDETQSGCTFTRGDDGKYRYGIWSGDLGVVVAVDARELQLIKHRREPIFSLLLTIRYRGAGTLETSTEGISLQFLKHFKIVQPALNPDDYIQKVQGDADAADAETRRWVERHPQKKEEAEKREQDYQKAMSELIDFLGRNSLRPAHLNSGTPEVNGWIFFNTNNKWLGGWKSEEDFVLRVPVAGFIFEFPFKLPPAPGELLLQKRP